MPVQAHTRVTFSGVFGSTTAPLEIWSFNINTASIFDKTITAHKTLADAAQAAYATHIKPILDSEQIITRVRAAAIGIDGRVLKTGDGGYVQADNVTVTPGALGVSAANRKPLSTALVCSLVTNRAGPSGKGRFFLPWPSSQVLGTDYRLSTTDQATDLAAVKGFIGALRTAGTDVLVVSSKDFASPVTGVRVGRTPDTMRSRRSHLLEAYSTTTL